MKSFSANRFFKFLVEHAVNLHALETDGFFFDGGENVPPNAHKSRCFHRAASPRFQPPWPRGFGTLMT